MARFLPLEVTEIRRETRDAVAVTLKPRDEDRAAFDFVQGQYLTFRRAFDGEELRRCYSICAGVDEGVLSVGVKRVEGGAFSSLDQRGAAGSATSWKRCRRWACFMSPLDPASARHYLAVAGGSGITPILSILKTTLAREPKSRFTLIYANRQISSIMFREELEDLKNIYLGRLSILHVLETDAQEIDLFTGRLTAEKCAALFAHWVEPRRLDAAFICGPEPMMLTVAAALRERGHGRGAIKFELFASGQPGRAAAAGARRRRRRRRDLRGVVDARRRDAHLRHAAHRPEPARRRAGAIISTRPTPARPAYARPAAPRCWRARRRCWSTTRSKITRCGSVMCSPARRIR